MKFQPDYTAQLDRAADGLEAISNQMLSTLSWTAVAQRILVDEAVVLVRQAITKLETGPDVIDEMIRNRQRPGDPVIVYPERWMSVWRNGVGLGWRDRAEMLETIDALDPRHEDILGILHLHPDGTTTMEAP